MAQRPRYTQETVEYDFEPEDIEGGRRSPSEMGGSRPASSANLGEVEFETAKTFQPKYDEVYKPIFEQFIKTYLKNENTGMNYADRFYINLHSHYLPVPVPLQAFVQNITWANSKEDPYSGCSLTIKLPISIATEIFSDQQGKLSPGQYLYISTLPSTMPIKQEAKEGDGYEIKFPEAYYADAAGSKGIFLGVVSSIGSSQYTDFDGNIIHEFTVQANSFIHNLQMGQYFVDPVNQHDTGDAVIEPDVKIVGSIIKYLFSDGSEVPFSFSADEWAILTDIINDLANTGSFDNGEVITTGRAVQIGDLTLGTRETSTSLKALSEKLGIRQDIGGAIQLITMLLGYPMLPGTFRLEPFTKESFLSLFYKGQLSMKDLIDRFYADQSKTEFKRTASWLSKFMRAVGTITNFTSKSLGTFGPDQPIIPGGVLDEQQEVIAGSNEEDGQFKDIIEAVYADNVVAGGFLDLDRERLGNFIKVATCQGDLPPSCRLRSTMPEHAPIIKTLASVQNVNDINSTIWGFLKGTFHFDEQMYELYPVLIPLKAGDIEDELSVWNHSGHLNPLHTRMGCVPYIIFRQVPMFPEGTISKDANNEAAGNYNSTYYVNKPYRPLTKETNSEKLGINTLKDTPSIYGLPFIKSKDIYSVQQQFNDLTRLNAVRIHSPLRTQQTAASSNVSLSDPIIDGEDALNHGLRLYRGIYPFVYKNIVKETFERDVNGDVQVVKKSVENDKITKELLGAYTERFFTTYGYENNTSQGTMKIKYQKDINIFPGMWIKANTQNLPMTFKEITREQELQAEANLFFCYITDVSNSLRTLPNGNVIAETTLSFERGQYGSQRPLLPQNSVMNTGGQDRDQSGRRAQLAKLMTAAAAADSDRKRKLDDVKPKSGSGGQKRKDEGEELSFEKQELKIRQLSNDRLLASGIITKELYNTLVENNQTLSDETDNYWELNTATDGFYEDAEAQDALLQRIDYMTTLTSELLAAGWITEDFAGLLQTEINLATLETKNPIPKMLIRMFNRSRKAQTGDGENLTILPKPPAAYRVDQWVIPKNRQAPRSPKTQP